MTDQKLISELYRRFKRRPETLDQRNLRLLADYIVEERGVALRDDSLVFTEMPASSPFREIRLAHIHGVADLGNLLAIVLNASIIFMHKTSLETSVHLKAPGLKDRLLAKFRH